MLQQSFLMNISEIEKIKKSLLKLKNQFKLAGILLSFNDGRSLVNLMDGCTDHEAFSAMCAIVIRSAQDVKVSINNNRLKKVVVEMNRKTLVIIEIDRKFFMAFVLGLESMANLAFERLEAYLPELIESLKSIS